jgi:hypothetical protein
MLAEGFEQSENDPCLFIRGEGKHRAYMLVHVDDVAVAAKLSPGQRAIKDLEKHFDVKDMGLMSFFLRQEVEQVPSEGIYLSHAQFTKSLLQSTGMWDCSPKATPVEVGLRLTNETGTPLQQEDPRRSAFSKIIGSLLYLSTNTRPDIAYSVSMLSRYMSNPNDAHFISAKRVLRYLRGTYNLGLFFKSGGDVKDIRTYTDADWGGDHDKRRSISGMLLTINDDKQQPSPMGFKAAECRGNFNS